MWEIRNKGGPNWQESEQEVITCKVDIMNGSFSCQSCATQLPTHSSNSSA